VTQGSHLLPPPLAGRDNVLIHVCLFVSRMTQKVMAEVFINLGNGYQYLGSDVVMVRVSVTAACL